MRPVLWRWRGVTVHSYPVMLYLGLVCGVFAGGVAARAAGLDARRVELATVMLLVPALVGARLFFVATHWDRYRDDLGRIWRRSEGGAAMYGGFFLAFGASVPLLAVSRLPFAAFWDVATFTILVGMIFARVGCLLNGCCRGRRTSARGLPEFRIPTQVLEMGFASVLLFGAVMLSRARPFDGSLFLYLLAGYGAGRCLLEAWREAPARLNFAISAALVAIAVVTFVVASTASRNGADASTAIFDGARPLTLLVVASMVSLLGFVGCTARLPDYAVVWLELHYDPGLLSKNSKASITRVDFVVTNDGRDNTQTLVANGTPTFEDVSLHSGRPQDNETEADSANGDYWIVMSGVSGDRWAVQCTAYGGPDTYRSAAPITQTLPAKSQTAYFRFKLDRDGSGQFVVVAM